MVFTANTQSLFSENFNALTTGNLASDLTGNTAGQNNWYYYADAGTPANFATVLSVGTNDNGLKLTGASSASGNPRFAFQTFDWASRTAGNDILYVSYKMNTGASSSSTNTFRTVAYDSKGKIIIGLSYTKNTKEIKAVLYDSLGSGQGQSGTFSAQLGGTNATPAALTLTDNTVYDLAFAYNVTTGIIYVFGQDLNGNVLFQKAYQRTYANSKMGFPSEFDVYAIAGTSNAASSNVTYDDIDVHANLCLFFDHKENSAFSYTSNSTCKLPTTFTATKTDQAVNGVFSSTNGLSITAATGAIDLANSTAGAYSVKFKTDGSTGCIDSTSINITLKDLPAVPAIQAGGPTTFCQGGSVNLSVTPVNSTTYLWSDNTTSTTSLNATISGSYTVTATSNGCSSTSLATVVTVNSIPSIPTITAAGATTFCQGSNVALNVTSPVNGVTYNWSNSTAGTSLNATSSGTYTATASKNGCNSVASNSIVVTVNNSPVVPSIQAAGATTFCQGGSVNLSITPANNTTYLWSDNTTTNTTLNVNSSGSYTVTATSNGCSTSSLPTVVTVNSIPSTPSITAGGATTFCQGSSVALNVTSPANGVTYNWSNSAVGTSLNATTAGTYTVTALNGGCNSGVSNSILVSVNNSPAVPSIQAAGATTFCQGGSVNLSITPANSTTYLWSDNTTTNTTLNVNSSGSYTVTATSNGCSTSSLPTVVTVNSIPSTPSITAGGATTFCQGSNVALNVTSPVNGVTYNWSNSSAGTSLNATSSGTYTVIASKSGCNSGSSNSIGVTVNNAPSIPSIQAAGATTFCQGGSVGLSVTPANSTTYLWSDNTTTNTTLNVNSSGSYTVTATSNGCSTTSLPTVVTVNTPPTTPVINTSGSTTFCQGGSVTMSITPANNTSYTWSTNATTNSISVTSAGTYTVTATANSCSSTSQGVTVSLSNGSITTPVILTSGSTDICSGNSVTLSVSPANNTTYTWSNSTSGTSAIVSSAGTYTVVATSNGCTATSTPVTVTLATSPTKPVVTAFGNTTFCQGGSVSLSVAPEANTTYTWSNNGTGNTVLATTSGYYVVTATKGGCSSVSNPVTVTVNPIPVTPVINVSGSSTVCQGGSSVLSVVPATNTTYLWSNSITGVSNTVTTSGNYLVTATSSGCSATSSVVTLSFINCAGIEETTTSSFKVFPNPSNDIITISFSDAMSNNGTINFVSADGKLVEKREYTNSSVQTFDVKSLNPGVYFFQIENKIEKVVVQ